MKALVMGGGMSGLATAINLLDLGVEVSLVEADEIFGGRASSWLDEDGDMIDNALHVFFPYYVNLLELLQEDGHLREHRLEDTPSSTTRSREASRRCSSSRTYRRRSTLRTPSPTCSRITRASPSGRS